MDFNNDTDTITPNTNNGVLTIGGTGALVIPGGTTASAPPLVNGMLRYDTDTGKVLIQQSGSTFNAGTVTTVSVTTANGVSGSVATNTTTPAITLTLGAITPTSVNSVVISGSATPTLSVTGTSSISGSHSGTSSGTNTGDQTITLTGNVTGSGTGSFATTIAANVVTNAMQSTVATATFKGRTTAGTGNVEDLTATQATALLNVFGADAGAGGVKGLVPATVAGDAARYLKGDGTWGAIAGGGSVTSVSVVSANGFAGTVATATTTPAITISTSVTGLLKGNGASISAAVAGTDYAGTTVATTTANGLMSSTDKKRMTLLTYDAVADFGFVGDLKQPFVLGVGYDGAITTGTPNLVCATTAPFAAGDVGKRITVAGAGAGGAMLVTTILAFVSSSAVTLAANAGTTVSAKCVRFGTDNTTAIGNMVTAVNAATYQGIKVVFPASETNSYGWPTAATFNKPVYIEGVGGTNSTDIGDYTKSGGTCLSWWGSSSTTGTTTFGAMLNFVPTTGANNTPIEGLTLRNFWIDCRNGDQNQALKGVNLSSCAAFVLDNFFIMDALAIGLDMDVVAPGVATPAAGSLGQAKDCTRGKITNLRVRMLDNTTSPVAPTLTPTTTTSAITLSTTGQSLVLAAANGLTASGYIWVQTTCGTPTLVNYTGGGGTTTLTGCTISAISAINPRITFSGANVVQASPANGACVHLNGDSGANTCCNTFNTWQLSHGTTWGPAALELSNSDSNISTRITINGGSAVNGGAANRQQKPGVRFGGSTSAANLTARNNVFYGGSAGAGGVVSLGVTNAGVILTGVATANFWNEYELGNGELVPVRESIATTATQGDTGSSFYWNPNGGLKQGGVSVPSFAAQAITAATLTHIKGSLVPIPPQGLQVGTTLRWTFMMTKTAAGTAANTFTVRLGTAGSTADAAVATFTTGLGTAVVDTGKVVIELTVRTLGAAATAIAYLNFTHGLTSTGWLTIAVGNYAGTMATFNSTTQGLYAHVCMQSGASVAPTVQQCFAECVKAASP